MIKRWLALLALALVGVLPAQAGAPDYTIALSAVSTANAPVTLTMPAGIAGTFHQLISVTVDTTCTAAIVGSTALTVSTANMPGSLAWTFGDACPIGTTNHQVAFFPGWVGPIASAAATNTTITCPAIGATGICRIAVTYRLIQP